MSVLDDREPRVRSTQKARCKEILRSAGTNGVCSLGLYDLGLPNGRTRVYELRDDDGLDIETLPCDLALHEPGTPAHVRFIWHWDLKPWQPQLLRAV